MYVKTYINVITKYTSYVVSRVTLLGSAFGLFLLLLIIIMIMIIIITICKDDSASVRTNCATEHESGCTL